MAMAALASTSASAATKSSFLAPAPAGLRKAAVPVGPTAASFRPCPAASQDGAATPEHRDSTASASINLAREAQARSPVFEDSPSPFGRKTVRDVLQDVQSAVGNATVDSVASVAALSGGAAMTLVVASGVVNSLHRLPLMPEVVQAVGLFYCACVVREHVTKQRIKLAPSPLSALSAILGSQSPTAGAELLRGLPEGLDEKVGARLRDLAEQRDRAFMQVDMLKKKELDVGRAVAEKEALEAVAMRLAEERDTALSEVTTLRTAVNAMTERMKAIEAMLAEEVHRLQEQNTALETVALQLADERDKATSQVTELRSAFDKQREEDKKVLEMLAAQLIEERNAALKEVDELKLVVSRLMQATGSESGLTAEMETFIKSRVRAVRSQFVDVSKPYAEQASAVDTFVSHLVEEYGAPREWTKGYIQQFLDASVSGHKLGVEKVQGRTEEAKKLA